MTTTTNSCYTSANKKDRWSLDRPMNPFVNFKKRDIQLPKGCVNLADVLPVKKCEYCDETAIATEGWPGDYRWCETCQRDLAVLAKNEDSEAALSLKGEAAITLYRGNLPRRQKEFMQNRVKERCA